MNGTCNDNKNLLIKHANNICIELKTAKMAKYKIHAEYEINRVPSTGPTKT